MAGLICSESILLFFNTDETYLVNTVEMDFELEEEKKEAEKRQEEKEHSDTSNLLLTKDIALVVHSVKDYQSPHITVLETPPED